MTLIFVRSCALAATLTTSTLALAQGAPSAAQLAPNPGVGAPQPGSGLPPEVTTRGSGAGASVPSTGSIGDTQPDTIVIDRRERGGRVEKPRADAGRDGAVRLSQSGSGTGNPGGNMGTGGATSTGGGMSPTSPNRTGTTGSTGSTSGMTPGGGSATSGTGQNARGGGGISGSSSTGSGNAPR